ncbi:hypothetical protein QYG89_09680 [Bacillus sp. B190/17]|uniref:DUF2564 family protein n=1 Tax=Bacillus lumedeiriae TaxID=3058829 RepID=A0ABW8I8X1_9BACI
MDHTNATWKNENVISQLRNSVDNVMMAVGQAQSNPTQQFIQQAQSMINRADNALDNALQNGGHMEPIHRLQEQLDHNKEQLQQLQSLKND